MPYTKRINDWYRQDVIQYDKCLAHMPYASAGVNVHSDGWKDLISYSTLIASVHDVKPSAVQVYGARFTCSVTTRKHFGAFLREYNHYLTYALCKRALQKVCKVAGHTPSAWRIRAEIGSAGLYYYDDNAEEWFYAGSISYAER